MVADVLVLVETELEGSINNIAEHMEQQMDGGDSERGSGEQWGTTSSMRQEFGMGS